MQQINLYLPEFQPKSEPMRSVHMLWGMGIFTVLLIITSVLSASANRDRAQAIEQSRAQLEQLKTQATQLEQQHPNVNLAELDAQILSLSQELDRREQIFSIIANKNLGNNSGFSAHLEALGRQSLEGVSLSAFALQNGGSYTEFAGKTHSADQIPLYIQRLRAESAFVQSAFGVLNLEPLENEPGVFAFTLAKQLAVGPVEPEPKTAVQMLLELNQKNQELK
ncbi:MAG TPA: MSHA biogenesis protein MshI [Cellvibrio sp.]|nr:MSHA biogenesis protein MshI [Cellvibrio sp.]